MPRPALKLALLLISACVAATFAFAIWAAKAESPPLPPGTRVLRDVAYGADAAQRLDLYLPAGAAGTHPVILMVHGGGWRIGNKSARGVVGNKAAHWLPMGVAFASMDYRMLPARDALQQADDVALALAWLQANAAAHGLDPRRIVLMGHSAGAHEVALLSAAPARAYALGARPWLGSVSLDSAALDVPALMQRPHLWLHDAAFGDEPARWRLASPRHQLGAGAIPLMAACSTKRPDRPCVPARDYVSAERALGIDAALSEQPLDHAGMNATLGLPGAYTVAVDAFLAQVGLLPAH